MKMFFHGINGNILFCCAVNELHEAMSFSLAQEIEPIRNITVRLEHTVHIRKLHQDPIPFYRPTPANAVSIEFQLVFRLTEKTFDRPTLAMGGATRYFRQISQSFCRFIAYDLSDVLIKFYPVYLY